MEGACVYKLLNLSYLMGGGDQFRSFGRINAEEAGMGDRWRADSGMNFLCAGASKHFVNLPAGGRPNDGIIDGDDLLPFQHFSYRVQFDFYAEMANSLLGFDECSSDI